MLLYGDKIRSLAETRRSEVQQLGWISLSLESERGDSRRNRPCFTSPLGRWELRPTVPYRAADAKKQHPDSDVMRLGGWSSPTRFASTSGPTRTVFFASSPMRPNFGSRDDEVRGQIPEERSGNSVSERPA